MFRGKDMSNPARYAKDLLVNCDLRFISHILPLWVAAGPALPFGLGFALTGSITGGITRLLCGGAVRVFLLHHVTVSINSLCHNFGRRPFTGDQSRNLAWLAPLAFGEACHNNDHASRPRQGTASAAGSSTRRVAHHRPGALPPGLRRHRDQPDTPSKAKRGPTAA